MKLHWISTALGLVAILALQGCGQSGDKPEGELEAMTQQASLEAQEPASTAAQEVQELKADIDRLRDEISSMPVDAESPFAPELKELEASKGRTQGTLTELKEASADELAEIESRFRALADTTRRILRRTSKQIEAFDDTQSEFDAIRHPAAGPAGEQTVPRDPDSGLLVGLDNGDFDPYLVSVVEGAQRALRERGIYSGAVDGHLYVETMKAIGLFQKQNRIHMSGVPSPPTRAELPHREESTSMSG